MNFVCVWCKREGKAVADGPASVAEICDQHRARFVAEVDAALLKGPGADGRQRSRRRSAPDATLINRVADALRRQPCVDLCDACLAHDVGIRPADVEDTITHLGTSSAFLRDTWRCARCGEQTLVTRARPNARDVDDSTKSA